MAQLRISSFSGFLTIAVVTTKPTIRKPRVIKLMGSIKPFACARGRPLLAVDKNFFITHTKCNINMDNRIREYVKKGLLIFLLVIFTAFIITWINSPMIVKVVGTGEVSVSATYATLSLTITGNGSNATAAIKNINTKVGNLKKLLISRGVGEVDLLESPLTVYPMAAVSAGATGFSASGSLTAKVYDETGVNELVVDLYNNGAALVAQPVMATENQKDLEQRAFDAAMKDAQDQAKKISRKHLKLIRKIVNISQASSGTTATATSKEAGSDSFKIAKAVQVSYKMW